MSLRFVSNCSHGTPVTCPGSRMDIGVWRVGLKRAVFPVFHGSGRGNSHEHERVVFFSTLVSNCRSFICFHHHDYAFI